MDQPAPDNDRRSYRYYDFVMAAFVTVLLCSNFIGAAKQAVIDLPIVGPKYVLKTGWEAIATPLTYKVVNFLKEKENEDYYDRGTNFNPFRLQT